LLCCARVWGGVSEFCALPILNPFHQVGAAEPSCTASRPELLLGRPVAPSRLVPDARRQVSTAWSPPRPHRIITFISWFDRSARQVDTAPRRCTSMKICLAAVLRPAYRPQELRHAPALPLLHRQESGDHTEPRVSNSASRPCPWLLPLTHQCSGRRANRLSIAQSPSSSTSG
jgi:hypothetical protein